METESDNLYINKISIQNLRGIREVNDLELKRLNVLIGPNCSGKSTFLDAFIFLNNNSKGEAQRFAIQNGGQSLIHLNAVEKEFLVKILFNNNTDYLIKIGIDPMGTIRYSQEEYHIDSYDMFQLSVGQMAEKLRHNKSDDPQKSKLSQLEFISNRNELHTVFLKYLKSIRLYRQFNLNPDSPIRRTIQPLYIPYNNEDPLMLLSDGSNLSSVLYQLLNNPKYKKEYNDIESTMSAAFGDFEKFYFPPAPGGTIFLGIQFKNLKDIVLINQLSDGIVHFLLLLTALNCPNPAGLIMLDEPELGLHPDLQHILAEEIQNASQRSQIILSTHSPQFLNMFEPDDVIVTGLDEKFEPKFERLSNDELKNWIQKFTLGELWMTGEIGGKAI